MVQTAGLNHTKTDENSRRRKFQSYVFLKSKYRKSNPANQFIIIETIGTTLARVIHEVKIYNFRTFFQYALPCCL
jgi:hypothetical protein